MGTRFDDAIESYGAAISLKPDYGEVTIIVGSSADGSSVSMRPLQDFEAAIALFLPSRAGLHNNRGNALQELKRLEDAIESYDELLR